MSSTPSPSSPQSMDCSRRLADQLQALSHVAETLTYRLLEFEERLVGQEQELSTLMQEVARSDASDGEDTERRLLDTEERLSRIEALLAGPQFVGVSLRRLHSVAAPPLQQDPIAVEVAEEEIDPFAEEPEQRFMDELTA